MIIINIDNFKELLIDYEDGNLTYSEMIELRDKSRDLTENLNEMMDKERIDDFWRVNNDGLEFS